MNSETRKLLTNIKTVALVPIKIKLDLTTLNNIIAFLFKDSVLRTRKAQTEISKLINNLDLSLYDDNPELINRIWIIQNTIKCRIEEKIETNNKMVQSYLIDQMDCTEEIKQIIEHIDELSISHEESKYLLKKIDDAVRFGYVITLKEIWTEIMNEMDDDFKSFRKCQEDLFEVASSVINIKRNTVSMGSDQTFSLDNDKFDAVIADSLQKLKDKSKIFKTGMQYLNVLLAPGYMSKRLYLYLAFPGKGKSTILLKSALDFKKYNKVTTKDPDKRPAVLFLTLENTVEETIERIYNMTIESDDIRNYKANQIIKKLKKEARLEITEDNNMDIIIKEYKNREIDTNDIYAIINDLSDEGIETVGLIIDYIKRLKPAERANDEKTELKNISNELKEIAKFFDVPVITAQQLNRSSATVVDAALQQDKEDVTRLIGRDGVAGAWELMENSDWVSVINPETKQDSGEEFLTFKMLKRRYRSAEESSELRNLEYFNQPFESGNHIKLLDDIYLDKPLGLTSLSSQFTPTEEKKRGENSIVNREKVKTKKVKTISPSDFDAFDPTQSTNF